MSGGGWVLARAWRVACGAVRHPNANVTRARAPRRHGQAIVNPRRLFWTHRLVALGLAGLRGAVGFLGVLALALGQPRRAQTVDPPLPPGAGVRLHLVAGEVERLLSVRDRGPRARGRAAVGRGRGDDVGDEMEDVVAGVSVRACQPGARRTGQPGRSRPRPMVSALGRGSRRRAAPRTRGCTLRAAAAVAAAPRAVLRAPRAFPVRGAAAVAACACCCCWCWWCARWRQVPHAAFRLHPTSTARPDSRLSPHL